jgi:regulator of sigma E protease
LLTTIASTIVVLGLLIFVHELGHFLVAKHSGVTVLRFSLGFGPRLFGLKRGDTDYCLSLIPLGGYVKMLGEEPGEEVEEERRSTSFSFQPVTKRIAIVLAGPLCNFLLAIVIFALIYALSGVPQLTTEIGSVSAGSPAEKAGILAGDRVRTINGRAIGDWEELSGLIEKLGEKPLTLQIERGEEHLAITVTPRVTEVKNIFGEPVKRAVIGITASGKISIKKENPLHAVYYSVAQTWHLSKLFLITVGKLIEGVVSIKTLGGPILIAQMAGQQANEGLLNLIHFIALISVNLAVLNLLPIPVLDGGHILFFTIEGILGKPIGQRKIEWAQKAGMLLLLVLMVFVFYNDIMRLMPGHKPDFLP